MLKVYAKAMDALYEKYGKDPKTLREHVDTLQLSLIGSVGVNAAIEIMTAYGKGVKE